MKLLTELDSLDNVKDGETRKLVTKATSSGSGNVVSSVSVSGDTVTYTKGVTALTAHQNAFSNVKVGSTTVAADSAGDTLELVAGSNVTLTPDATNDKVTIAATDTTYESKAAASGGTAVSLVTTGEKYTWNNKGNGTITGVSVNGSSVATSGVANITNVPTSILTEPRFQSYATITNQTLFHTVRANRLAFLPADQIIVEKSTDAGTTWEDAGWNDTAKRSLFTGLNSGGGSIPQKNGKKSTDCMLRITISAMKYTIPEGTTETNKYSYWTASNVKSQERYCTLQTMYFWMNAGADRVWLKVERATGANPNNWTNIFDTSSNANRVGLTGWSGMDFITFSSSTFGGGTTQTSNHWNYRLTFRTCTSDNSSEANLFDDSKLSANYITQAQGVSGICGYGDNCWGSPNSLMSRDHLYSWDADQNATFPKNLTTNGTFTANDFSTKKMIVNTTKLPIVNGKISSIAANNTYIGSDGIGMSNPGTVNDAGWLRMLGTGENDSVLELAVGDDGSSAAGSASNEEIAVRKYNTSNTVSKEIKLFDKDNNSSFPGSITATGGFVGDLTGNASTATTATKATGDKNGNDITTTYYKASNPNGYTSNTGTITGVSVNGTSVATSGVANITSMPASILSGAIPSAVTATTQSASDNSTKIATTAFVKTAIDNLPEPMVFKGSLGTGGTVTALPVDGSATIGDTYKVITAGTYASKAAKVGDTFICLTKTSSANTWELIPSGDEPSGTVTSITIKGSSPITVDSESAITTSGTRTISHANSGVTAGTYRSVTVNATGHVTAGTNPTTLSGYGITDAKIASGVITLGSNTITPLTASSTLDATKVSGTLPTSTYTDTKNTAGSTDSSSKLFLIGATSQAANSQTYSQDTAYVGTDGHLYSNSVQVVNLSGSQALTNKTYNGYTLAAACAKAVVTTIDTSASLPTSNAVKTFVEGKGYVTTDTKNTAGSTDTSSKIFLIGATSQAANPQTYSDNEVYATSGVLTTKSVQIGGTAATMQYNSTDKCIEFVFA